MKKLILFLSLTAFAGVCIAKTHTVIISNNAFTPQSLTILVGDTVEWSVSEGEHTTTSGSNCNPNGFWASSTLVEGMKYKHGFPEVGIFNYFCIMHCSEGMTGTISVVTTIGINELGKTLSNNSLKTYPNPFISTTNINFNADKTGKATLQVLSLDGKTINTQTVNVKAGQNTLPLALNIPSGTYIVRLQLDAVIAETRIVARKE
jgi:plastocyanin